MQDSTRFITSFSFLKLTPRQRSILWMLNKQARCALYSYTDDRDVQKTFGYQERSVEMEVSRGLTLPRCVAYA
jgi:hypothetical protein